MKDIDMSKKMKADERALIESAQADLAKAKGAMKSAMTSVAQLKCALEQQGLGCEAGDAYEAWAAFNEALAGIHTAHAKASGCMMRCYPENGGEIIVLGGGGR